MHLPTALPHPLHRTDSSGVTPAKLLNSAYDLFLVAVIAFAYFLVVFLF